VESEHDVIKTTHFAKSFKDNTKYCFSAPSLTHTTLSMKLNAYNSHL